MGKAGSAVEILLGIGFKVGLLICVIGAFMMFIPVFQHAMEPLLSYYGVLVMYNSNPLWVKAVSMGLLFMGLAFFVSMLKDWFDPLIELLFFEDNRSAAKKL